MSRHALLALLLSLPALALPAGATPASPPPAPPLAATLSSCTVDADGRRSAAFTASMPGERRGGRLALRLVLLERTPPAREDRRVDGAEPDPWVTSRRGAGGLVHERRVKALRPPADYRMEVRFRWYDAAGRVIRTARRHTPACRPPREP